MPDLRTLRGLKASDRSKEEQRAIDQQMGYKEEEEVTPDELVVGEIPSLNMVRNNMEPVDTTSAAILNNALRYQRDLDDRYQEVLNERQDYYGTERNSTNTNANSYIDGIANEVSSYYKKYKNTDKLPISDQQYKELASMYDARKEAYGEDNANIWLDNQFKDIVGNNQSWLEQAWNGLASIGPTIEGGAIQAFGNAYGAISYALGNAPENQSPDLGWWDGMLDAALDNDITRYGRDLTHAKASNVLQGLENIFNISDETAAERIAATKATATKYNPEGIGENAIVTTQEQDNALFSSATPWQALESGGFTALSMLVGAGEARIAGKLFGALTKGVARLHSAEKVFKTAESVEKALRGIKRAQNVTDMFVIPGAVGTMEGAMEGLNTKIDVERKAVDELDNYYQDKVEKEAQALYNNNELNPLMTVETEDGTVSARPYSYEDIYKDVWDKYQDEYTEARRQIDWASSKAGIHNFYVNSLINGAINQTLKAGIMAPRVQETLRNSRMFGWAYKNPAFSINASGVVTPKSSTLGAITQVLKEPLGESLEEYGQGLSNDVFVGAAENNINEFIKNKFEGDGSAKVTDSFGSDYAAALTALGNSLTSKESIQAAILGAVSSTMGTVGGVGRGYHRDSNGNLVRNSFLDPRNLGKGYNSNGEQESWLDYARRVTPWRSGAMNAYFDRRSEMADANDTAATLTEWLKDPQNRAKWDGLAGTASWMTQMENAAESNDQFSYRKAQMGKAINDVFMLSKLKGTEVYDTVMKDLQRASAMTVDSQDAQNIIQQVKDTDDGYLGMSDEEIVEKIQSNANRMLGLMSTVEAESKSLDRLLGRIDEDTKQSLIFGKIMEQDFREREEQLGDELDTVKSGIRSSRASNGTSMNEGLKNLIIKHGSITKAIHEQSKLQEQKEKLEKKVSELEAIDSDKTSDKQKEELVTSKAELRNVNSKLEEFKDLYEKDENGKSTGKVDSNLVQLVLNEQDIMDLDPVTRAIMFAQGAAKYYNTTHQNRQKIDQLDVEIDELNRKIDKAEAQRAKWANSDGKVKKHHNKQVQNIDKQISELKNQKSSKLKELDKERGLQDAKPIYSSEQQAVIDNLIQQGTARDANFVDKVIDMGRLEKGIKDYHTQYQAILSDPRAFQNYVQRAKYNAETDLIKRRAERISRIDDFEQYSQELDRLTANASQGEVYMINNFLRGENERAKKRYQETNGTESPQTNYDRYVENNQKQLDLIRQFAKNPNLTENDQSLLINAMQYLASKGIDVSDREAAVSALIERDEQGIQGGMFRKWIEAKNSAMLPQQRTAMPVFTSIGQVVSQYVDLINGKTEDAVNKGNLNPQVTPATTDDTQNGSTANTSPSPSPSPSTAQGPSLFDMGYSSPDGGQIVDGDGTVATDTQVKSMQQRQQDEAPEEKTAIEQAFEKVTTPEVAKSLNVADDIINNSNVSDEAKELAREYFMKIPNGDETYSNIDEVLTAIQEQINRLKGQSNTQAEQKNKFSDAAGVLQKLYNSLNTKKLRGRGRTMPAPSTRTYQQRLGWILSANIAYIQSKNPDAWAVKFTDEHRIDGWHEEHTIDVNEPIFFITDSDWTAEVTAQMGSTPDGKQYNTQKHLPLVAAVKVETPQNPNNTTAIEVDGQWYQPIAIMPSSDANTNTSPGAFMTEEIRKRASQLQGRHLVTVDGMPNSSPLITKVHGANYLKAHHRDATTAANRNNVQDNNTEVLDLLVTDYVNVIYGLQEADRLRALSREEMLADPVYQEARNKFLNGLSYSDAQDGPMKDRILFTPENHRSGEKGNPMMVFRKDMDKTTGRTSGKPLPEVLENGTGEEVVSFNSRTQRLYDEVIRPLFQFLPLKKEQNREAMLVTRQDLEANPNIYQEEAERLTKMLNGFSKTDDTKGLRGINDFIYITDANWRIQVTAPQASQVAGDDAASSKTVYKVFFVNSNYNASDPDSASLAPIPLGEINAGQRDTDGAMELLRNIMWDSQTNSIRSFLVWQTPKSDVQNLLNPDTTKAGRARRNYADIVDDGILTIAGSSLIYDVDGVELQAPVAVNDQGYTRIVYPYDTVVNPSNAKPSAPQNVTPQGDGAVVTKDGAQVDPDSGAKLDDTKQPERKESDKLKRAKEITQKIISDSKQFTLSEDETYYYITDNITGERTKYLRVTTVIGADKSLPELTEAEAKRRRVKQYIWTPSTQEIYDKLRGKHNLEDRTPAQLATYKSIDQMSADLKVSTADIRRAVAELRTQHKQEKYGAWGTPSTSIGNTVDVITRDFLAGHVKDNYPNVTKEVLQAFVHELELFKNDLDSRGIHIVSEGVMAHGNITMTDADGTTHDVKVAGTLDLFGYDDDGNFYIFDMKTVRDHSTAKLTSEKAKWSRQVSMYADLLKQSYGVEVDPKNLRIIPIDVNYPTPRGSRDNGLDPMGPEYSETADGQLLITSKGLYKENGKPVVMYRGYALTEDREATSIQETIGHTAVDYDDSLKGALYFTSSKEEAQDYANARTDKSPEPPTQENPQGRPVNRHYTGDYAKVSQYHIAANAKVEHYKDIRDYIKNGKNSKADVIVLDKGTLQTDNSEYIVKNPNVIVQPNNMANFTASNPKMKGTALKNQFQPGYTPFNIGWDNLSSEDQDIMTALTVEVPSGDSAAPQAAEIETPKRVSPAFVDDGSTGLDDFKDFTPTPPPVVPNGQTAILPAWDKLSDAAKGYLQNEWGISNMDEYNEILNSPDDALLLEEQMKCGSFM